MLSSRHLRLRIDHLGELCRAQSTWGEMKGGIENEEEGTTRLESRQVPEHDGARTNQVIAAFWLPEVFSRPEKDVHVGLCHL